MIYYFSATGNSKYICERISNKIKETKRICITKDEIEKKECYDWSQEERIGFIFPTYWYGVPTIVEEFLQKLEFSGYQHQYIYLVVTYGVAPGNMLHTPLSILKSKGIEVNGQYGVRMVDNYVIARDMPSKEEAVKKIHESEPQIQTIVNAIAQKESSVRIPQKTHQAFGEVMHHLYQKIDHAKGFYVTDACIDCGYCEKHCPTNAIVIENHHPVWKNDCTFCLGCIHNCPVQAVQYHKSTKKRNRYYNPLVKDKMDDR